MRYRPQGDLIRGGGVAGLDWKNANRQRIEDDNARGAVNASAQRRSSQGEIPELLSEPSKLEVVLGRSASSRISDDIYALTHRDNRECGGFLYGPGVRSWDRRITPVAQLAPGTRYVPTPGCSWTSRLGMPPLVQSRSKVAKKGCLDPSIHILIRPMAGQVTLTCRPG
jgi:hypothetical protein